MTKPHSVTRRDFLRTTSAGAVVCGLGPSLLAAPGAADAPALLTRRGNKKMLVVLDQRALDTNNRAAEPIRLAAEQVRRIAREQLGLEVELRPGDGNQGGDGVVAACPPWNSQAVAMLKEAGLKLDAHGRLSTLADGPASRGGQGFMAARLPADSGDRLLLVANEPVGLRNALLTLADRLYVDADKNIVADPFWGVHVPAFQTRHLKMDAMNCGRYRTRLEYWDPTCADGVQAFADWLAGFRITDYDLLAFMRGWGTTYRSERFPNLADPQHPNVTQEFYPRLIDRLHGWGVRVCASDIYMASGYLMELGTEPRMASPQANMKKLRPFKAGAGTMTQNLCDPQAIVCLSNPAAAAYYANVVDDLLAHYPTLDALNFHVGHALPWKYCRCAKCKNLTGNREMVYRCFARVYEAAIAQRPDVRLSLAVKMFGDATRRIVEHAAEFPRLELFCWLRSIGMWAMEGTDARVAFGHEDGGGGLEADFEGTKPLAQLRAFRRDFEPHIQTYVSLSRKARLAGVSWEPQLQRELENQFFCFSQLSWEPDLTWKELARRYVIRSERALNERLAEAYQMALEANAAINHWSPADQLGTGLFVAENSKLLETPYVRERVAALGDALSKLGLTEADPKSPPPVAFDLRRSLVGTYRRLKSGKVVRESH
jgi:hypothetical protein